MLAGKILMATSRESRVSFARYTSPMPPAPSEAMISYGPSLVPEVRAIIARHYIRKRSVLQPDRIFLDKWSLAGSDLRRVIDSGRNTGNSEVTLIWHRRELKLTSLFPAIFQNQPVTEVNEAKDSGYS